MTGRSRSAINRDEKAGLFPKRLRLGPNSVGWLEAEIRDWIASRPRA
jgi:prophage regulatory protein